MGRFILIINILILAGECQYWNGCNDTGLPAAPVNCVPTDTEREFRCFCLHNSSLGLQNWSQSSEDCRKIYKGNLAIDDTLRVHDVLSEMVASAMQEVWIGARTIQMHWNWLPTLENSQRKLMSYQGCYTLTRENNPESRNIYEKDTCLRQRCNQQCAENDTFYYTLQKTNSSKYSCKCYKAHRLDIRSYGKGDCQPCDLEEGYRGWCGDSTKQIGAVYLVNPDVNFSNWTWGQPLPLRDDREFIEFKGEWESSSSYITVSASDIVYCSKGYVSKCEESDDEWKGEASGKCFRRIDPDTSITHRAAVERCEDLNMSLISITSKDVQHDIRKKWDNENKEKTKRFWVAGTNFRWQWVTGVDVSDRNTAWPRQREPFAFEDLCLTLTLSRNWAPNPCQNRTMYICETVVNRTDITSATLEMLTTTVISSEKTVFTTMEDPTVQSSNQPQVTLIAVTTVAGLLLLVLLVVIALVCHRYRRRKHNNKAEQIKIDNLRRNMREQPEYDYMENNKLKTSSNLKEDINTQPGMLVDKSTVDAYPYESAYRLSNGMGKNTNNQDIIMVDNDLYNATDTSKCVNSMVKEEDNTVKDSVRRLMKNTADTKINNDICDSRDIPINMLSSGNQYYNFIQPGPKGGDKSNESVMVENDIYISTESNTSNQKSADIMVDNIIYESSNDATGKVDTGDMSQAKSPKPYIALPGTGNYELASPTCMSEIERQNDTKASWE